MSDFVRYISSVLLVFLCLLPLSQQAEPEKQAQHSKPHFGEERLSGYRQDKAFRYEINPYRRNTIWQKINYFLARLFKAIFSEKGVAPFLGSLILLGIIIFAVIKLSDGKFQWIFGKESKNKTGRVVLPDEEIGGINFTVLADQALQEGDLRLCVRYHYLYILKKLDENAFIRWNKDKTNRDYLREIQVPGIRSQFRIQTLAFDYVWYGKFPLSDDQFQNIQSGFENLIKSIQDEKGKSDER